MLLFVSLCYLKNLEGHKLHVACGKLTCAGWICLMATISCMQYERMALKAERAQGTVTVPGLLGQCLWVLLHKNDSSARQTRIEEQNTPCHCASEQFWVWSICSLVSCELFVLPFPVFDKEHLIHNRIYNKIYWASIYNEHQLYWMQ